MGHPEVAECVRQAQGGNRDAWGKIYLYLWKELLPWLKAIAPRGIDPEDLFHDTVIVLWGDLCRLRDETRLLAYASRIARHILTRRRIENARSHLSPAVYDQAFVDPATRNPERDELLRAATSSLRKHELYIFNLYYCEGASNRDVALSLRVSLECVRQLKHRMNAKLRTVLMKNQRRTEAF
jgi:RNA polymerase sigma factor (sigma-70 family)